MTVKKYLRIEQLQNVWKIAHAPIFLLGNEAPEPRCLIQNRLKQVGESKKDGTIAWRTDNEIKLKKPTTRNSEGTINMVQLRMAKIP